MKSQDQPSKKPRQAEARKEPLSSLPCSPVVWLVWMNPREKSPTTTIHAAKNGQNTTLCGRRWFECDWKTYPDDGSVTCKHCKKAIDRIKGNV